MFHVKLLLLCLLYALNVSAELDWWKNAVFYQIYPRSFMDGNNDGIGDLKGIESKLDHLVDAGVSALWLSPIYTSPQVDQGYDISDYRDVDPIFGTLDDFKSLVSEAKNRGLRVILDFVPNHSSDQHEWFIKSLANDPDYADYYIWREGKNNNQDPPNNWISYFHGPAWSFSSERNLWYLHQFSSGQPDLNYRNPKLVQEMKDVLTYWLDVGVDGFRVDIISALFEHINLPDEPRSNIAGASPNDWNYLNHIYTNDQAETYDMVYQWRALLDDYQERNGGDVRVMMTESYSDYKKIFGYYGNDTHNGAHFTFNFWFITELNSASSAHDIVFVIDKWLTYMPLRFTPNWVLGNHDQHRVATRYGSQRVDGLAMISMLLPGVAVTYNGEEIGMENGEVTWEQAKDPQACNGDQEDFLKNSRDFQRTPYQWNDSINAGFNTGAPTWLPVSENYQSINLAAQKAADKSHYQIYQEVVKFRKVDTIKHGGLAIVAFSDNVLGIKRYLKGSPAYVLLVNIGGESENVNLSYLGNLPQQLTVLLPSQSEKNIGDIVNTASVTLDQFESIVLISNN